MAGELGFVWDPHEADWEEGFHYLTAFKTRTGDCRVPAQYVSPDGYKLGSWVSVQRLSQKKLKSDRKARLDALGFNWDPRDTAWEEGLEHLRAFVTEHGHCGVPPQYKSPDGYKLGRSIIRWRSRKDTLTPERIELLNTLRFDWDPIATQWEEGLEHLQAYLKEYGDCCVPFHYKSLDGFSLGTWVVQQRHKSETLSPERKVRLNALGFDWDPNTTAWEKGFEHLAVYVSEYKDCRVPIQYRSVDGYQLGYWVGNQRQVQERLSAERKSRLDALGFDWDPVAAQWEIGFQHLQAYKKEQNHCCVPTKYKSPDGYKLGQWVNNQRARRALLSSERQARLDALGFFSNTRAMVEGPVAIDIPHPAVTDTTSN
jgi:Helicase associated domain